NGRHGAACGPGFLRSIATEALSSPQVRFPIRPRSLRHSRYGRLLGFGGSLPHYRQMRLLGGTRKVRSNHWLPYAVHKAVRSETSPRAGVSLGLASIASPAWMTTYCLVRRWPTSTI